MQPALLESRKVPGGQLMQVGELPVLYVPRGHAEQTVEPSYLEKVLAGQLVQLVPATVDENVPAAQAVHVVAFAALIYPAGHGRQRCPPGMGW